MSPTHVYHNCPDGNEIKENHSLVAGVLQGYHFLLISSSTEFIDSYSVSLSLPPNCVELSWIVRLFRPNLEWAQTSVLLFAIIISPARRNEVQKGARLVFFVSSWAKLCPRFFPLSFFRVRTGKQIHQKQAHKPFARLGCVAFQPP